MILPINKEIKNYKQKVFFGLTVRRFIFLVIALAVGVITYFSIRNVVPFDIQTWIIGAAVIPVALLGFLEPYGMPLEKFLKILIRNKFLISKHLVFKSDTLYMEIEKEYLKIEKEKSKKQDKSEEVEGDEKKKITFIFIIKKYKYAFIIALAVVALIGINKAGLFKSNNNETVVSEVNENAPYYEVDENSPVLLKTMNLTQRYISLNPLDDKGRASAAMAILGIEDLQAKYAAPKTEIVPTGFSKAYYYELVNDKSDGNLFVVDKLIPFTELKKENAITQTRYMSENIQPFIDQIKKALEKKLHVIVSVIPEYEGDDVICKTLKYQAYSVEDNGESVSFNMVFNNIQPGIEINYSTGESVKE